MVKYFLLPRAIWFSEDLTVDKMKNTICLLKLSFLFCHVRNKLGLPTWASLGSKIGENNIEGSKRVVFIHCTIKPANKQDRDKKDHGQR